MMFAEPPHRSQPPTAAARPPLWLVTTCLLLAGLAMAVAVYFGGTGRIPVAMIGTVTFIVLGGLGFDLARRRSG